MPAYAVQPESTISVHMAMEDDYVSRGALKLLGAFNAFAPAGFTSVEGKHCLDIGASTGGFCDVLLRRGAAQVIALDVGHGQLDPRIADDPRVIEMSGVNMRYVGVDDLPYRPDVIVSDVSFISLTYLMAAIAEVAAPAAQIVLLVKPQFEVGQKGRLGQERHRHRSVVARAGTRTGGTLCARTRSAGCGECSLSDRRYPMAMLNISSICVCRNRRDSICCVMEYKTWRASAVRDSCEELWRHLLTGICFDER